MGFIIRCPGGGGEKYIIFCFHVGLSFLCLQIEDLNRVSVF